MIDLNTFSVLFREIHNQTDMLSSEAQLQDSFFPTILV